MTVIIKCQHSKIKFEAKTKRTKQHPLVAEFKDEAARQGDYRLAVKALDRASNEEYAEIDEYMEIAQAIYDGSYKSKIEAENKAEAEKRKSQNARQEAKENRRRLNGFLRKHGYTWNKITEEHLDNYGANAFKRVYGTREHIWELWSPDGKVVNVKVALNEIAENTGEVYA